MLKIYAKKNINLFYIEKREGVGTKHLNDSKAFIEY